MLRLRSPRRARGVMACLFLCAWAIVATAAVKGGGDGDENGYRLEKKTAWGWDEKGRSCWLNMALMLSSSDVTGGPWQVNPCSRILQCPNTWSLRRSRRRDFIGETQTALYSETGPQHWSRPHQGRSGQRLGTRSTFSSAHLVEGADWMLTEDTCFSFMASEHVVSKFSCNTVNPFVWPIK